MPGVRGKNSDLTPQSKQNLISKKYNSFLPIQIIVFAFNYLLHYHNESYTMLHLPTHSAGGSIHFHEFLSAQNKNKSVSFFLHPINPNYPYSKVNIMIYLSFCELAIPFSLILLNISQRVFGVSYLSCTFILLYTIIMIGDKTQV